MLPLFRRVVRSLALLAAAGAVGAADGDVPAGPEPVAPAIADFRAEEFAAALLAETNRVRREHGRRPLRRRWELEAAAADQAVFMSLTGTVQHTSAVRGQATPAERVRSRGLEPRLVSENVAAKSIDPDAPWQTPAAVAVALVAQWMASPPHRANLLNRDFTHFGGAVRFAPMVRRLWAAYAVQVFAAPEVRR